MVTPTKRKLGQDGFTIIELMIATMVFSVILLVVTFGVIYFTKAYYKGVSSSKTQDATRSVIDSVSQSLQFGNASFDQGVSTDDDTLSYFCAGGYVYSYTKAKKFVSDPPTTSDAGIYAGLAPGGCLAPASGSLTGGKELLTSGMTLIQMDVKPIGSNDMYNVAVTVAYGDISLLCDRNDAASCDVNAPVLTPTELVAAGSDTACRPSAGSQFCAVSSLSTIVRKRI